MTQYTGSDGLTYEYDSATYTLSVSGTGNMTSLDNGYLSLRGGGSVSLNDVVSANINNVGTAPGPSEAFYACLSFTTAVIGNNVTELRNSAFYYCIHLATLTIGTGVTIINQSAFSYCNELASLIMVSSTPCTLNSTIPSITTIYVPYGSGDAYKQAWSAYTDQIVEMSPPLKHVTYQGSELQVESAVRDGDGNVIDETYATLSDIPSISITESGLGNVVTGITASDHALTVTKGTVQTSTNWGSIGGTLSNQTDLQNALNAKAGMDEATTSAKGLMSATDKTNVNANTSARHTHDNKSTLDSIEGTATATTLGIDTVVTSGSNNLITSGAVYNVVGDIEAALQAIRGV